MIVLFVVPRACPPRRCGTHRTQYYDLVIRESRYSEALHLVLTDFNVLPPPKNMPLKFWPWPRMMTRKNPCLFHRPFFKAGNPQPASRPPACLVPNARPQKRPRAATESLPSGLDRLAKRAGSACDVNGKKLDQPKEAAAVAYQCLEDPALEAHQAAVEIRSLLAKSSVADVPPPE